MSTLRGRSKAMEMYKSRQRSPSEPRKHKTSKDLLYDVYERMGVANPNVYPKSQDKPPQSEDKFQGRYRAAAAELNRVSIDSEIIKRRMKTAFPPTDYNASSYDRETKSYPQDSRSDDFMDEFPDDERRDTVPKPRSIKDRVGIFDGNATAPVMTTEQRSIPAVTPKATIYKVVASVNGNKAPPSPKNEEPDYFRGRKSVAQLETSHKNQSDNASVGTSRSTKSFTSHRTNKSKRLAETFLAAIGRTEEAKEPLIVRSSTDSHANKSYQAPSVPTVIANNPSPEVETVVSDVSEVSVSMHQRKTRPSWKRHVSPSQPIHNHRSMEEEVDRQVQVRVGEMENRMEQKLALLVQRMEQHLKGKVNEMENRLLVLMH